MRRLGVAAALVALVWWIVAGTPAQAAAPSGGISSPTNDAVLTTKTPTVRGSYSQPGSGRVDEVAVIVQSAEGHGSWSKVIPGNGSSTLEFSFQVPELAYNGRYRAQSQAKGTDAIETNGQETSGISVRDFSVAVPPVVPTGLRATPSSSKQQVSLTWNANPEPDMLGYEVLRQASGSSTWTSVAQSTTTSAVDPVPNPGTWKYRLVAIRAGATSGEGVTSEPSPATTTTVDPPPTTTTTAAPSGETGGGGSSEGTSSGSSTGTGSSSSGSASSNTSSGSNRSLARAGRVDLSGYAALLDANRRELRTTPTTEYDPGYNDTLPFQPVTEEAETEPDDTGEPVEVGFTRTTVTDEDAQRRKMAYFAGSFLAFVLAMHGWFIRGEVRRQEELESLAPATDGEVVSGDGADPAGGAGPAGGVGSAPAREVLVPSVVAGTPEAARARRRADRAARRAQTEGPRSPVASGDTTVTTAGDDKGGRSARRAARGVSSRPGHDRPEGGAALRAGSRGRVGRDRRPAV